MGNCKNCGAPRTSTDPACPYCGTLFAPVPVSAKCAASASEYTYTQAGLAALESSIFTPNELRAMFGLPRILKGV